MESSKMGVREDEIISRKRDVLFIRYIYLGLGFSLLHIIIDYFNGNLVSSAIDIAIFIMILVIYFIAKSGRYFIAKVIFLLGVTLALFVFSNLVEKMTGVFFIFFPLVAIIFTLFEAKHRKLSIFFSLLAIAVIITLEIFDYQFFGPVDIEPEENDNSFIVNLVSSIMVMFFAINFLVTINSKAEDHLRQNQWRLRKLAKEVKTQNETLAKTNTELDRFVYSASHDLKAPLMSILGLVNLADRDRESDPKEYLDRIKAQVEKLDFFIKDIISYSRNTRVEVKNEPIDFDVLIDEVIQNMQHMHQANQLSFQKTVDIKRTICSDRSRLSVIISNLISNAIKYHNYEQAQPEVCIAVKQDGQEFCISVRDNGPGIPVEHQKEIFDMFFRASENSEGSGLGLYIVKEMAGKLNGKIQLNSQVGKGAEFKVSLPLV